MLSKIASGAVWLARGAAMLAGFSVVLVLALVGVLMMLAVFFGMLALPVREPSRTKSPGRLANSRRNWPGLLRPRLGSRS